MHPSPLGSEIFTKKVIFDHFRAAPSPPFPTKWWTKVVIRAAPLPFFKISRSAYVYAYWKYGSHFIIEIAMFEMQQ